MIILGGSYQGLDEMLSAILSSLLWDLLILEVSSSWSHNLGSFRDGPHRNSRDEESNVKRYRLILSLQII